MDRRDDAVAAKAIDSNNLAKSELLARIVSPDPEVMMPPPESHKQLTPAQKQTLKAWVEAGAVYEPHWSLISPKRPELPAVSRPEWVRNPIDRFVMARLDAEGLAPAPEADRRTLASYGITALGLSLVGLGIFWLWPTAVPVPGESWAPDSAFAFLKNIDASGNACPSMHVAFAVLTAIELTRQLRELRAGSTVVALNWLWCVGILYSTIATRQHVVLDVIAGALLGALFAIAHHRWCRHS